MRRWIDFTINHPKIVFSILILITILAAFGFKNLHFDSRTETLMPKDDIAYKMGERAKEVFIDTKTYMLVAIEAPKKEELISYKTFRQLNELVTELEEFKDFNFNQEKERLSALISIGNISYKEKESEKEFPQDQEILNSQDADKSIDIESELDNEILGGQTSTELNTEEITDDNNIWDLSKQVKTDFYTKPERSRRIYNYNKYSPVKYGELEQCLDHVGSQELRSILRYAGLKSISGDHYLTKDEFVKIMETWETLYLYKSMEIIKTFNNPISGEDIQGTSEELKPLRFVEKDEEGKYILPKSDDELKLYREKLTRNPSYKSMYYSSGDDGRIQALALNLILKPLKEHDEIFNYFFEVIDKYNSKDLILTQAGGPVITKFVRDYMKSDLFTFMPLVIIVVIITFFLNFRTLSGVLLPTVTVLLGTFWTLGLMGIMNIPITLIVNMMPPLLVAVGSSYSIHIFNQYLLDQEFIRKHGKKFGLVTSMSHISITVILAGFTTFIGFITLTLNQIVSLRDFGIFSAIGTAIAVIISTMLIPSSLMLMKTLPVRNGNGGEADHNNIVVKKLVTVLNKISLNHSKAVVAVYAIIIVVLSIGITKIYVETSALEYFEKDSYLYKSDMRINSLFEGSIVMNLIVDSGKTDGIKDPQFLKMTEEIREWIVGPENKEKYLFLHTLSFGDVIKRMHMAMNSDNPDYYKIPDKESAIRDYLELYSGEDRNSDGRVDSFESFVDPYYRYANIMVRIGSYKGKTFSTAMIDKGQKRLTEYLMNHPEAGKYKWHLVGEPINYTVLSTLIVKGQLVSLLCSLIIVLLVILFLFKNINAGLIALVPISTTIIIVYGTMGFLGIPLDIAKALLAAVAIGIGIDDTIHMLKTIRHNLLEGQSIRDAITTAHNAAGMAILYTSLALIFGFAVLFFSEFKPVYYLAWLVVSTMAATTIGALLLLPAIIIVFNLKLDKEKKWRIFRLINLSFLFKIDKDNFN